MGTAEQAITLLHLRLLFFNKTSCSERMILEVFRIANLCQSFLKMHAFDLRSAMQPDLVLWKLSWVVIHVGHCTSTPPPWHGRHLSPSCDLRSSVQAFNQIALADFLDLNLFPQTSTTCTCLVCTVQTTSDCANQPVNQLDGHVPTTSELSWKSVDCDWWLVDSSASFSASSSETASHYGGTSPFPADPGNFLPQMEAVFLWSRSQLLMLSFGHRINVIVVKSRSKCIFIAWLMDHVVNNSHTELGFDTFWWLEASGFKALFLELFSDSFQLMIQHVFLKLPMVAKWFWCRPRFYWRNPRSRSSIKCQCNRFF